MSVEFKSITSVQARDLRAIAEAGSLGALRGDRKYVAAGLAEPDSSGLGTRLTEAGIVAMETYFAWGGKLPAARAAGINLLSVEQAERVSERHAAVVRIFRKYRVGRFTS